MHLKKTIKYINKLFPLNGCLYTIAFYLIIYFIVYFFGDTLIILFDSFLLDNFYINIAAIFGCFILMHYLALPVLFGILAIFYRTEYLENQITYGEDSPERIIASIILTILFCYFYLLADL